MSDSIEQRLNMVESQVRPSDVTDRRIIRAMLEIPREGYAPAAVRAIAYMDAALPVSPRGRAPARYLLAPRDFAKLVQLADIGVGDVVLDVGCATGYSTAVLSKLAKAVIALESDKALADTARAALAAAGVHNAIVLEGDLAAGAPEHAPFDAIVLNGAVPFAPQTLLDQLKDGGRLVAVLAQGPVGRAQVWRRSGAVCDGRPAFDAAAEPLPGFARAAGFVL